MSFRSPLALLLVAALVPAAWALFASAARRRTEAVRLFLGARAGTVGGLEAIRRQRTVRAGLLLGALGALGVALAGPRLGVAVREARQESLDLLVALDVSDSMRADDVAPSRLERAKLEVSRVLEGRRGDRVGLVVFAGEAFLQAPLTTDLSAVRLFLDAAEPDQIALQGTDFARALAVADRAFDAAAEDAASARPRALLVVSDGEDHEGGLGDAADALRDDGVAILALGVGTEEGAEVPDVRRGRVVGSRRGRGGEPVISRFEPGALRALAGRGNLYRIGRTGSAAPQITDALDGLDRAVLDASDVSAEAERFQWPLALAVLLLLLERAVALRPASELTAAATDDDDFRDAEPSGSPLAPPTPTNSASRTATPEAA